MSSSQDSRSSSGGAASLWPDGRKVYRSVAAAVIWYVSAVIAAVLVLVTGVAYVTILRPRVVADAESVLLRNPLRDIRVPWGTVTGVELGDLIRVRCQAPAAGSAAGAPARERVLHGWALQSSRRSRQRAQLKARRRATTWAAHNTGFAPPATGGHPGQVRSVTAAGHRLLIFVGRTHLYEGHGPAAAVHSIRTAAAAGAHTIVLTNAAGAINPGFAVGQPVLISDHINLTGRSPLTGPRFVDLTGLYSPHLRELAREEDQSLAEGVYACFPGPHYETPAEIRMARTLGADLAGMSTVLEAIAAREAGCAVLAFSLVTNMAAGLTGVPLEHAEVLEAGRAAAARIGRLIARLLPRITAATG